MSIGAAYRPTAKPDGALARLVRARARLCDAGAAPVPLDVIAREAGLSTSRFIRRFRAMFGETPHQMRIRVRLEAAKRLLAVDGESVTGACYAVGFSSLGSFSHLFAQRFGESPSAFRRRCEASPDYARLSAADCLGLMHAALAEPAAGRFSRSAMPRGRAESMPSPADPAGPARQETAG